jgi:hypothetical protein
VLIWEEDHMVRHIYLTDKHSPDVKPSWFGESIGHYENGDTLVVDTVGLSDAAPLGQLPDAGHRTASRGRAVSDC